jgi:hypothetical protein
MLHFVQYDSRVVIPNTLFCHSERERGIHSWMLHCAQHDKSGKCGCFASLSMTRPKMSFRARARNPLRGCFTSFSMTRAVSFRTLFFVIPSVSEESIAWMLRFVQHDSRVVIPNTLFCHSERHARNPLHGCFASFSMTNQASVDASLRSA